MQFAKSQSVALCLCLATLLFASPSSSTAETQPEPKAVNEEQMKTQDLQKLFEDEKGTLPALEEAKQPEPLKGQADDHKTEPAEVTGQAPLTEPTQPAQETVQLPPALPVPIMNEMEAKQAILRMLKLDLQIKETTRQVMELEQELTKYREIKKKPARRAPVAKKRQTTPPVILSIQGIETSLTATLRFNSHGGVTRTVFVGDSIGKSTVTAITKNYVQLSNGSMLRFKE